MKHSPYASFGLLALLAAGVMLVLPPGPSAAQQTRRVPPSSAYVPGSMGIPQPEPKITLSIKQRSLGRILSEIFKQTPYKYLVRAEVGASLFDLDVQGATLSQALQALLSQDKGPEPMVFFFTKRPTGEGIFTFDRELITVGEVEGQDRVSLTNARLTKVLPAVFKKLGAKYRIEPDVPPVLITMELRPNKWTEVLPQVMMEAYMQEPGLTYSLDGDTYVIHLHKIPTGASSAASGGSGSAPSVTGVRKITKFSVTKTPLRDALTELFKDSAWKIQVSDAVKDVNISYTASSEPEFAALTSILKQAAVNGSQVTYREGKGVLYIEPGPLPGEFQTAKSLTNKIQRATYNPNQRKISEAARSLGQLTGAMVKVAPDVPDLLVTFSVKDATIEEALQSLVDAAKVSIPNLSFRSMGEGSYVLELSK